MNLLKSLVETSSMTIFSRILGFARDVILARFFGADIESDAFFVAFKIPNLLRRFFAEGSFSQAFIPILIEYKKKQNPETIRIFISCITGLLMIILTLISVAGILFAPWIILITSPGFSNIQEVLILSSSLLRIVFPYVLIVSLSSLASAILNTWNQFLIPAFSPAFLNISMICFLLLASPLFHPPIMALAWGAIVGGALQLFYQLPYLKKINILALPRIKFRHAGVLRVLKKMWPGIFSISINQISLIISTIFISFLEPGSVSWIYYADRLMEFPSGVLGVALGTILLPSLSHSFTSNNYNKYSNTLDWGLRLCFMLALPSSVAFGILAHPLTMALFQYGKFSAFDALMTQKALTAYSIGLVGLMLIKVLSSGFYSRHDTKTPAWTAIITLIMTQLMNLIFIGPLKHAGLSLSISLAASFNAGLLYWQLRKKKIFQPQPGWLVFFYRLMLSVIIMAISLIGLLLIMPEWTQGNMFWRLFRLIGIIVTGTAVYFTTLSLVGFRIYQFLQLKS